MISFDGYLTEQAERFFWNNSRKQLNKIWVASSLFLSPIFILASVLTKLWIIILFYCFACLTIILITYVPKTKKYKMNWTPKQIFADGEYIVAKGMKYEEYRLISDVIRVVEYKAFYYITFTFGKKSDKFICQKSLLTKGTLEEFESLFEGKIERRL